MVNFLLINKIYNMSPMLIDIINHNAERRLLSFVEDNTHWSGAWGALHFECSKLPDLPNEENILLTVRPVLENKHAAIHFFNDGDVVITWNGTQKTTLEHLCSRLYERYRPHGDETLHHYYDVQAHGEDLRLLCKRRIDRLSPSKNTPDDPKKHPSPPTQFALELTPAQIALFSAAARERKQRLSPEVLIVEDQSFSTKLLRGMLERSHKIHTAANAEDALELYLAHAPDIIFLDIELPGVSGHQLAAIIHKLDAQAFIIMVTGNNHADDVVRAKQNGARGFIVKPYSKQKILEAIQKFLHEHNMKP
jgi:two-component system chemotaxis response regulator CheY